MHPIKKYFAVVPLCMLALAVGWWLSRPNTETSVTSHLLHSVPATPNPVTGSVTATAETSINQPFARTSYLGLSDPRWVERRRLRLEDPSYQWRTPIEFYGKVVDQNNLPIDRAEVEIEWVGTSAIYGGDGVGHKNLASDANGLFIIKGIEGKRLGVLVRKEGYHSRRSWNNGSFEYAGFWEPEFIEPDPTKPIVFHMVKKREAEPTYHLDSRVIVKASALKAHLNLLSKPVQKAAPSDLFVRITRPPDASHQKPFDWKIEIEGRNGSELAESEEEFMTLAPAEGYNARIVREYKALRSSAWPRTRFYVRNKSRNLYAAVEIEAAAFYPFDSEPGAALFVTATINPNNSPNLEYDPTKDIREMAKTKQLRR